MTIFPANEHLPFGVVRRKKQSGINWVWGLKFCGWRFFASTINVVKCPWFPNSYHWDIHPAGSVGKWRFMRSHSGSLAIMHLERLGTLQQCSWNWNITHTHTHTHTRSLGKNEITTPQKNYMSPKKRDHFKKERIVFQPSCLLPRNLTWNLKMMVSKRNLLFQGLLFRFHVKFQGCKGTYFSFMQIFGSTWVPACLWGPGCGSRHLLADKTGDFAAWDMGGRALGLAVVS